MNVYVFAKVPISIISTIEIRYLLVYMKITFSYIKPTNFNRLYFFQLRLYPISDTEARA